MEGNIMFRKLFLILTLVFWSLGTEASQLVQLEVYRKADVYEIRVIMEVDAPAEAVRAILTDYARLDRLNASITASEIIGVGYDGTVRVLTHMENCILFFCMKMQKVEDVSEDDQGRIQVSIVPDSSSFRSEESSWEIQSKQNGSRVLHHAKLVPDLWVPPWIGTAILKNSLRIHLCGSR
jgi:hypothetical protein